jgi:NAD+ kinase
MKIAIYGRQIERHNQQQIVQLFKAINSHGAEACIYKPLLPELQNVVENIETYPTFENNSLDLKTDYFISIGGDGTILDAVTIIKDSNIPILGINTGRLGFLSNTPTTEVEYAISCLQENKFSVNKRTLIQVDTTNNIFGTLNFGLNELSILKRDSSSMITIHTYIDGDYLNSYWADGLIVSTATGSTAYSLSCGGPIMMPGTGNFTITPIAPHNLNVRPIVIDDFSVLEFQIETRAKQSLLALDSRSENITSDEKITVRKADFQISLIQLPNQTFISSLRNKLNWGLDRRNK